MITQEKVLELYDRANPVSDVENLKTDIGAASYLATLEQRSSEVTQLEPKQSEPTRTKRSMVPWLIAAGVAAVIGVAVIIAAQNTEQVPVADQPTPTAGPVSSLEDFAGTYENVGSTSQNYLHILEDGTLHFSSNRDLVEDRPEFIQETKFEGTKVLLRETRGSCVDEDAIANAIYEVQLLENGNLKFVAIEDTCLSRSSQFQIQEFAPVS